jgi:D-alanyl-D-alanine carboxypeptidase
MGVAADRRRACPRVLPRASGSTTGPWLVTLHRVSKHARAADRRWLPIAVAGLATVLVLALVGVQLRAGAAEADRTRTAERVAAQEAAAQQAAERAAAEAAAQRAAAEARAATETGVVTLAWSTASRLATDRLASASSLLAETDGEVADDAVRDALAAAIADTQGALDAGSEPPEAQQVSALSASYAALGAATDAVEAAHTSWQAAPAEAAAAAERKRSSSSSGWTTGAGPDCGGKGSYQPSTTDPADALYTSVPSVDGDGSNGHMPRSAMSPLSWCTDAKGHQQWLRSDAAAAMTELNAAFRAEFGENIAIDLSYRSYDDQVRAKKLFGGLAATPGTSNHGLGLAIDTWEWKAYDFGSARYEWLVAHGPDYGWVCPAATEKGNPEYWHFEYVG